jgi:hypothetical protein
MVRDHCRAHTRKSYRWYVNGELYKQVLAPRTGAETGRGRSHERPGIAVHRSLDYLRWPIQFESKGTSQTNGVMVAIDHWSIWEPV